MKAKITLQVKSTLILIFALFTQTYAQDVEIEGGKLTVHKSTNTEIEVATDGANSDAWIQFGDDGSANEVTMGWDGGDEMFKLSLGTQLDNFGLMIKEISNSSRFGLGSQPDDEAKVFINHLSSGGITPSPQLFLRQNNNASDGYARFQFGQFGVAGYWHVAAKTNGPRMNFYYHDGASGNNILVLDGDDARVGVDRNPSTNAFEVNGTASKTAAGDWVANSDRRIKTNIKEIENSFETLLKLRPVTFKYSEEWRARNPKIKNHDYYNFIAQEYGEVFPESMQGSGEYLENDPDEILQIDTYNAQIVNIAATQQLIKENKMLKEQIIALQEAMANTNEQVKLLSSNLAFIQNKTATAPTSLTSED